MQSATRPGVRVGAILGGLAVAIVGVPILIGGVQLLRLHGSPYYLIAGVALVATGVLLALRRAVAGWLYAALLLATLVWGLWEAGFVFWSLLPRLVGPGILGGLVCLTLLAPRAAPSAGVR